MWTSKYSGSRSIVAKVANLEPPGAPQMFELHGPTHYTIPDLDFLLWMICRCKELIIPYLYSVCCSVGGEHAVPNSPPKAPPLPLQHWGRCYLSTDARHGSFRRLRREVDGGQTERYGDQDETRRGKTHQRKGEAWSLNQRFGNKTGGQTGDKSGEIGKHNERGDGRIWSNRIQTEDRGGKKRKCFQLLQLFSDKVFSTWLSDSPHLCLAV